MLLGVKRRLELRSVLDAGWISELHGTLLLLLSLVSLSTRRKLVRLIAATRRLKSEPMQLVCENRLERWLDSETSNIWRVQRIGWDRYCGDFGNITNERDLSTSLLLKEPGRNGEKGVLYCSFEFNWMKLVANHDARRFFRDYILVGASSWSPGDHAVLANLCGLSEDPVFIGISNTSDIAQYKLFSPWIYPLPIMACDWIDPTGYVPIPHAERSVDILMVAHFSRWKRHWLLFEALRKMDKYLSVVLIGRHGDEGRTEREIRNEAKAFGVKQELIILRNLEIDDVTRYQCDARVSVSLSKREGSCVAVTEAMFADTPVAMLNDAHIGARAYINDETGRILSRKELPHALSEMIERSGSYTARSWAMEHISASASSNKLNDILKRYSLRSGRPWTRDIAPLCWRYVPRYLNPMDKVRLGPGLDRLRKEHGVRLKEFVSEQHALRRAS